MDSRTHSCFPPGSGYAVRDFVAADSRRVAALNAESESMLSPMSEERLDHLRLHAAYARVAVAEDETVAFLLAASFDAPGNGSLTERPRFGETALPPK